ncbi:hypothetical protein [Pseudomonas asiatica]|uniref:hypothetical protein n=1 Tax=Pseudomonas asiatica TaxID=2219225 RepID=UPI001AAED447|nr:hypothetical protein [Pseudomonas asiatica]MBO2891172.1 hypothetical protein [Pseudomonas asiatica]
MARVRVPKLSTNHFLRGKSGYIMGPSGISRRIQQCIAHYSQQDYEGALVNLFPAIDKTASKRHPKLKVGPRIRKFLDEEMILITATSTGGVFRGLNINGVSIEDAIYKFGRTSVMHEGEIDPRLTFTGSGSVMISEDDWRLPTPFILGMTLAVILSPENSKEKIDPEICININGHRLLVNDCWGKPEKIQELINRKFGRQILGAT